MNSLFRNSVLSLLFIVVAGVSQAANAQWFFGLKLGLYDYAEADADMALGLAAQVGYQLGSSDGLNLSLEMETTEEIMDIELETKPKVGFDTKGTLATLRTGGPQYYIFQAGEFESDLDTGIDQKGKVFGIGMGNGGERGLELMYNAYQFDDNDEVIHFLSVSERANF